MRVLNSLRWLFQPSLWSVLFALRLVVAVLLALYLAMWLNLGRPFWAGVEVALMIQVLPGNTVARAAARLGATLVAGVVALVILGLFQQTPVLMIVALAAWVSACAFSLQFFRNNLAHAFGVAGFITAVIVMFTVSSTANDPFGVAQSRVAECWIAALVTAAVNVLFSAGLTKQRYHQQRRALLRSLGEEIEQVIAAGHRERAAEPGAAGDPHPRLAALAQQIIALDELRPYVRYEYPGFGAVDQLAQRMDRDLLSLTSALSSLHVYIARRGRRLDTTALDHLAPAAARLKTGEGSPAEIKHDFDRAHTALSAQVDHVLQAETPTDDMADRIVLSRAREIADRVRAVLGRQAALVSQQATAAVSGRSPEAAGFSWPVNWQRVVRNSLGAFTAILMAGTIWLYFHNQMATVIMVALGGAVATLFSPAPSPVGAAIGFGKGAIAGTLASFLVNFLWLPMATGYVSYIVVTAPVLFVAGLAMTQSSLALPARITVVVFELTLHTQNHTRIDLPTFVQFALGIYGAVAVAMLAFSLVLERDPERQLRHQIRQIFKELARGLHGSRERFEARIYDRFNQLALLDADGRHPYGVHQAVLAAINLVLEARRLRMYIGRARVAPALETRARSSIDTVEQRLRTAPWDIAAMDRLRETLSMLARDLDTAFRRERVQARRRSIGRAAISAELMASALIDYEQAAGRITDDAPALVHA